MRQLVLAVFLAIVVAIVCGLLLSTVIDNEVIRYLLVGSITVVTAALVLRVSGRQ